VIRSDFVWALWFTKTVCLRERGPGFLSEPYLLRTRATKLGSRGKSVFTPNMSPNIARRYVNPPSHATMDSIHRRPRCYWANEPGLVAEALKTAAGSPRTFPVREGIPDTVTRSDPLLGGFSARARLSVVKCIDRRSSLWRDGYTDPSATDPRAHRVSVVGKTTDYVVPFSELGDERGRTCMNE